MNVNSDSTRGTLWRALTETTRGHYEGRVLNLNAQTIFPTTSADNRLIAGCAANAVPNQELHPLDLILKVKQNPDSEEHAHQRFLLGQVLSVKGYPCGNRGYKIALRVRRTVTDVDELGHYLGDIFMLVDIVVQASTVGVSNQDLRTVSEELPLGGGHVKAEHIGPDTDSTFSEVESFVFPVPAIVLDDDGSVTSVSGDLANSDEEESRQGHDQSAFGVPRICKIVGPNPQEQPTSETQGGGRSLRMEVRFTRLTPQSWRDICTLPEQEFDQAMERLSREMRDGSQSDTGTLSDHIPQGLLVGTVVDQCDWQANPTLTLNSEHGEEIALADVLQFHEDAADPEVPVNQRLLSFTVYDRIRDVVEVILIVARLVEESEPSGGSSSERDHQVPRPPGPDPPTIRAVRLPSSLNRSASPAAEGRVPQTLAVIPASQVYPAFLPTHQPSRFSRSVPTDEPSPQMLPATPALQSVSESLYTDNLESILEDLEREGKQLETTHTARPSEVKQYLERWVESMRSELDGHLGIGSLTKHVGKEARSLVNTPGAEVLPALAVYTAKPPKVGSKKAFRRKCRAVACGNFTEITSEENTYSAGAQAEAVRIALAIASSETWSAYVTDISQAFLRAPLPDLERLILLKPPAHFIQAGICDPTEIWRAHRAVYGLREAPKWWSDHRDQVLRQASWVSEGQTMHLEQLEGSVWLVKDEEGQRRGVIVVYVDDCLVLSTQGHAQSFHAFLNQVWETSPLEGCQEVGDMVQFLGMNITKTRFGFSLGQQPYLNDLMAKYQVESQSPQMAPRDWVKEEPEQQEYEVAELRRAQSICGELLWVSQRTRPDISHTTALLASWTTRDPSLVYKLGLRMLQYLHGALEYQLVLEAVQGDPLLQCFTDASFAPFGSRSYSGIAIKFRGCLVMWRATKQSLVTLSSSEAELVAATEGVVLSLGVREILQQVSGTSLTIDLLVDNTSPLQLLQGRGANRTRHLRIRSNFVKERVEAREVSLHHIPGERQEADLFTKVLPGPRLKFLRGLVWLQTSSEDQEYPVAQAASVQQGGLDNLQSWLLFLVSCLQMYTAGGQGEEPTRLEVEPPYELMLLTALVVLSVIALWEGGRGLVGCCATRVRPRVCSVRTTKGKSVEERVQEAIKKELDGERLRQERGLVSRGKAASAIRDAGSAASQSDSSRAAAPSSVKDVPSPPARHVPPPPVNTYRGRASSASQTDAGSAVRMQDRGSQTEVPYPNHLPTGIPPHQVCTTMQRGGVVHLYDDCPTLGVPAYRQTRAFCQRCLGRYGLL